MVFKQFKEKLENKCKIHDITLIIQEESYTSKSSFLYNDILPKYQPNNDKSYEFKGTRIKRGLYKTSEGKLINADVMLLTILYVNVSRNSMLNDCKSGSITLQVKLNPFKHFTKKL